MKKRAALLLALAMLATTVLAGCGSKEDKSADNKKEDKKEAKVENDDETLIVGFDASFPPYGYKDDDGEYVGFDLELAQEVCDRNDWKLVKQPVDWDAKDMEIDSGTIDCIWNGFTMTGREDEYTWSEPYMENSQVVVVLEDSGIESTADLAGKIVEVQADSSAEAALKEMPELTESFAALQTTPDYNTAFMDLEMGSVDAIAMDVIVAGYQLQQRDGGFKILDDTLASEEYAIGFKKGNEALRDQVQTVLDEMASDGTMKEISEKWFGEDITTIGK